MPRHYKIIGIKIPCISGVVLIFMLIKMIFLIIFGLTSVKLGKEFQLKEVGAHEGIGLTIGVPRACKWAPMLSPG